MKQGFWAMAHEARTDWCMLLGSVFLMLAGAFLWTRHVSKGGWSWVRQLGITSLLVYWVHIEMVYGRELFFLKNRLTEVQTGVAAVTVILVMLGLSVVKTRWVEIRAWLQTLGWWFGPKPDSAAGD
jgi:fucose 4-O-acetylase-like acetyltransferase